MDKKRNFNATFHHDFVKKETYTKFVGLKKIQFLSNFIPVPKNIVNRLEFPIKEYFLMIRPALDFFVQATARAYIWLKNATRQSFNHLKISNSYQFRLQIGNAFYKQL